MENDSIVQNLTFGTSASDIFSISNNNFYTHFLKYVLVSNDKAYCDKSLSKPKKLGRKENHAKNGHNNWNHKALQNSTNPCKIPTTYLEAHPFC